MLCLSRTKKQENVRGKMSSIQKHWFIRVKRFVSSRYLGVAISSVKSSAPIYH